MKLNGSIRLGVHGVLGEEIYGFKTLIINLIGRGLCYVSSYTAVVGG